MQSELFEWDDAKEQEVFNARGITFAEASSVLLDPYAITRQDTRQDYGEKRFFTIGMSEKGNILGVAWTTRELRWRIISAWKAEPHQRRQYVRER